MRMRVRKWRRGLLCKMTVIWGSVQFARGDAAVLPSPIIGHLETHKRGENPKKANFAFLAKLLNTGFCSRCQRRCCSKSSVLYDIGFLGSECGEGSLRVIEIFKGFQWKLCTYPIAHSVAPQNLFVSKNVFLIQNLSRSQDVIFGVAEHEFHSLRVAG